MHFGRRHIMVQLFKATCHNNHCLTHLLPPVKKVSYSLRTSYHRLIEDLPNFQCRSKEDFFSLSRCPSLWPTDGQIRICGSKYSALQCGLRRVALSRLAVLT